jgi:hypothetical protein
MALVKSSTVKAKRFYRQTFEMKVAGIGSELLHTLLVNPEDMQVDEPARVTVTQTLGGAFVTDFGQGLPTVTISGTTGYKKRTNAEGRETDGFEEFKNFRDRIYRGFISENDPKLSLYWYNWEDDEYYQIQPTNFRLMRNKAEPLLYRYEFRFTCIRKLRGSKREVADDLIDPRTDRVWVSMATSTSNISEFLNSLN